MAMAEFDPDTWPACWVLSLIAADNVHAFYTSKWWKAICKRILRKGRDGKPKRRCYDCERKTPAEPTLADTVHHVHPLRERPDLALSEVDELGNIQLLPLCASCHWERHHQRKAVAIPERW